MLNPESIRAEVTAYLNDVTLFHKKERMVTLIIAAQRYILGSVIHKSMIKGRGMEQEELTYHVERNFSNLFESKESENQESGKEFKRLLFNLPIAHLPAPLSSINVMLGANPSSILRKV